MKRREILKYTALATAAAVSPALASTILSGCNTDLPVNADSNAMQFFKLDEMNLVKELVDVILPKTESPSASDVGVHKIIDVMVGTGYKVEDQIAYRSGFISLTNYLSGKPDKFVLLSELVSSESESLEETRRAFVNLKQQTIAFYLSTEEISKNYLNYLPVPGEYEACITLEEVDNKAWAL